MTNLVAFLRQLDDTGLVETTIGNTNKGTSTDPIGLAINLTRIQATSDFAVTKIYAKVEGIAGHYRNWYDVAVDPRSVAVTTGSSGAFQLVFLAAFDSGDRVALASPGYPAYRNILAALGVQVVEIPTSIETRYQPTPALLDAAEAKYGHLAGLVIASPANPTGTMLSRADLTGLVDWCRAHGTRLILPLIHISEPTRPY